MERYDYKSVKQDRYRCTTAKEHPSFSSTLLDSIYRSIDENDGDSTAQEFLFYRESMKKNQTVSNNKNIYSNSSKEDDLAHLKRTEKKKASTEKIVVDRRKSMPDLNRNSIFSLSMSSASDSSFSGFLSSNEADQPIHGVNSSIRSSNVSSFQKPKPIRTSVSSENNRKIEQQKISRESSSNNLGKTKSRALKIYNDLKKAKQPISPGGRLASFLNSLFTNANVKKTKNENTNSEKIKSKSAYSSTCSSASSYSRSCLSKTPSSTRGNNLINGGMKRSVRFYPESVILDDDFRPVVHKPLHEDDDFRFIADTNVRNAGEKVRDVMKNHHKHFEDFDMKYADIASDNDDDDDDASCASSDLFELDHLVPMETDRYSEELPVYETTHFGMNRSIAKGLLV